MASRMPPSLGAGAFAGRRRLYAWGACSGLGAGLEDLEWKQLEGFLTLSASLDTLYLDQPVSN